MLFNSRHKTIAVVVSSKLVAVVVDQSMGGLLEIDRRNEAYVVIGTYPPLTYIYKDLNRTQTPPLTVQVAQ